MTRDVCCPSLAKPATISTKCVPARVQSWRRMCETARPEIERMVGEVEVRSPERVREYCEKLLARMKEVLADTSIDETRIVTEAAIYAGQDRRRRGDGAPAQPSAAAGRHAE